MPHTLPHHTQTHTVLIIDDEPEVLDALQRGLQRCSSDYTVLKADTVSSALDLCRYQAFDCVVLDLDMNDASGFEVLFSLVPDRLHREIPVVVLTRLISPSLHEMAVQFGAMASLIKQRTSPQQLHTAIQSAIAAVQTHNS